MNNQILADQTVVWYVVRANGRDISAKFETQLLAEMEKQKLSPELKAIAEVIPIHG